MKRLTRPVDFCGENKLKQQDKVRVWGGGCLRAILGFPSSSCIVYTVVGFTHGRLATHYPDKLGPVRTSLKCDAFRLCVLGHSITSPSSQHCCALQAEPHYFDDTRIENVEQYRTFFRTSRLRQYPPVYAAIRRNLGNCYA